MRTPLYIIIILLAGSANAQVPRCDVRIQDAVKIVADWSIKPNPPGIEVGKDEKLLIARCDSCTPPVAMSIKTTDLTIPDKSGTVFDPAGDEGWKATFSIAEKKKKFADWYAADIQRLYPGCKGSNGASRNKPVCIGQAYGSVLQGRLV